MSSNLNFKEPSHLPVKKWRHRLKKALIIFISTVFLVLILVFLFISPIAKYLIERYDEEYTGRKITVDRVYVNPFTGYIHISNLKVYERNSDSVFLSAKSVGLNITERKLFAKTYEISELTLDQPRGIILQNEKDFNYTDLIEKFSSKDKDTTKEPVHFNILNIRINDGLFYYRENTIPINYHLKKVNVESKGIRWDNDTLEMKFSFLSGIGNGDMNGNCTVNMNNLAYKLGIKAHKFDLNIIEQYLKDITNYGTLSANVDADLNATGNFNDQSNINAKGMLAINDFHFGKNRKEDYASFDKLVLAITALSPNQHKYLFDSVSLTKPYFKYEYYDKLDNLQTMFGKSGVNLTEASANATKYNLVIEIAKYVEVLSKNFFRSNYRVGRLAIYDGNIKYKDFSLSEEFSVGLNPLNVSADSIDKDHDRVKVKFASIIEPFGYVQLKLSINPNDSSDFDLHYYLTKVPVTIFNPYTIFYTSFPLDRGTIEMRGAWNVRNGIVQSINHLLIIDPRATKRIRNKDSKWVPMPLIMSFIRERGNVIDYEIPITGNLKNPKFHWRDPILDLLTNLFVKPATTPYRMKVSNVENTIEKSITLKWQMRQNSLTPNQERFIKRMTRFLKDNPDAIITVSPQHYIVKEKEYIVFYEAKKKYFLLINHKNNKSFTELDSEKVERMSIKDSFFVQYLNKIIHNDLVFTMQEKCWIYVGQAIVNAQFAKLNKERYNAFMGYFKDANCTKQVKVNSAVNIVQYNGFSFYRVQYKGELPRSLVNAASRMDELNNRSPRKKYKREHKANGNR